MDGDFVPSLMSKEAETAHIVMLDAEFPLIYVLALPVTASSKKRVQTD